MVAALHCLFIASAAFAQDIKTSVINVYKVEPENEPGIITSLHTSSTVGLAFGSSSNVAKLKNEVAGNFLRLNPSLLFEYSPSDALAINTQFTADMKQYSEEKAQNLAAENGVASNVTAVLFYNDSWEFGGDVGVSYNENNLSVSNGDQEPSSMLQKYLEPDSRIYSAWISENASIETGIRAKSRRYSTTLNDRGNTFYNDHDLLGADIKAKYSFNKTVELTVKSLIENKQYKEKPADFTDGAPSALASFSPALQETSVEHGLTLDLNFPKAKFSTTPSIRFNKDRIFAARDSQVLKVQQRMVLPVTGKLTWSPSLSIAKENFKNFRADPLNNPVNGPLREETDLRLSSPFKYAFSKKMRMNIDYTFSQKSSNYSDSSYSETVISTGLNIVM